MPVLIEIIERLSCVSTGIAPRPSAEESDCLTEYEEEGMDTVREEEGEEDEEEEEEADDQEDQEDHSPGEWGQNGVFQPVCMQTRANTHTHVQIHTGTHPDTRAHVHTHTRDHSIPCTRSLASTHTHTHTDIHANRPSLVPQDEEKTIRQRRKAANDSEFSDC